MRRRDLHDRLVSKAFDHSGRDAPVDGRNQSKQQPRRSRCDQRRRDHAPAQVALASVLANEVGVRDLIVTADLVDRVRRPIPARPRLGGSRRYPRPLSAGRASEPSVARQWSGRCSTSARTASNEALPEPMTIEARSSTVGIRKVRSVRPTSWRLARCGERSSPLTETSEVHDLPHPGESGDVGEVRGRPAVENLEVTSATHRVDEVIHEEGARRRALARSSRASLSGRDGTARVPGPRC